MTKRVITIILISLMLCGCQAEKQTSEPVSTPTPTVEPTPEPTLEPTPEPTPPSFVNADGSFELYGVPVTLNDEYIQLSHVHVDDNGEKLLSVIPFMPNLKSIDMDSCGVDNEYMEIIRDACPDVSVVWRIWFGNKNRYSVRTDVEKILASNPGADYEWGLTKENSECLKYCTKVKYLDLGHNDQLSDISFCQYMPDLEIAILAMAVWTDATPLSYCPKLEYAELQTSGLSDLTPLTKCTNLKHLNICHCGAIWDITPIYDLPLERLWIGIFDPVSQNQIEKFKELHPNCAVNTTAVDPTSEEWRYMGHDPNTGKTILAPYYQHLRDVFQYRLNPYCYSYVENDPLA